MKNVSYDIFKPVDSVIIMAAGPSISSNFDGIRRFQAENPDHVVLACNYDFPIDAEYPVFIDNGRYRRFIDSIRSPNIIIAPYFGPWLKKKHFTADRTFYKLKWNADVQPYDVSGILVNKDGSTGHKLGNCGMTCLYLAHMFRPTKVLVAGLDGPQPDNKTVKHFNNITRTWTKKDIDRVDPKKKYLRKLVKFLRARGAETYTFSNCPFWEQQSIARIWE